MKLADALPLIRTGEPLLFWSQPFWRSPFSWLIGLRTRSVYSHAGLAIRVKANGYEKVAVLEALEPGGVRLFPLDERIRQGAKVDWYAITDPRVNGEKAAHHALRAWGHAYAWRQLVWTFSRLAAFARCLFKMKLTNIDKSRFFCSQLVTDALLFAGYEPEEDIKSYATDPGAIARFPCLQLKGTLTL